MRKQRQRIVRTTVFLMMALVHLALAQEPIRLDSGWVMKTGDDSAWAAPDFDDSQWQPIEVGTPWENAGHADYDGYAWYRLTFVVPANWKSLARHGVLSLSLGSVDDADVTYFNGTEVGRTGSMPPDYKTAYYTRRFYRVPTNAVRWGRTNVLSVRVYDDHGDGGLYQGRITLGIPRLEDLIDIEFQPKTANGITLSPDRICTTLKVKNHANKPYDLKATIELVNDRVDTVKILETLKRTVSVTAKSETFETIEFKAPAPGFYHLRCTLDNGLKKSMVVGYEPEKIVSPITRRPGFEAFWKARKQDLAEVAPEFKVTRDQRSTSSVDVYLVQMQSYGDVTVRGWYTVPKTPGPHPAILSVPGYTSTMWPYVNRTNVATFALNPRGHGNSKDDVDPKGAEYMYIGFDTQHPEEYIYTGAYMDCLRAVDFLVSRPEVDPSRIGVEGGSQGGGLSFATAALDDRIMFCAPDIPWMGDWVGYLETTEWSHENYPKLIEKHPGLTFDGINRFLSLFDTLNMAQWITCPVLMSVGLQDEVCPPRTSFAPYNAVTSEKEYHVYPFAGHGVPQEHYRLKDRWMASLFKIDRISDDAVVTAKLPAEGVIAPFLGEPRMHMQQVFSGDRFPNVVVATDGTVLTFWNGVKVRRSEDGGRTFGDEISVGKGFMGGGVTVDENTGDILAFVEAHHPPAQVSIYRSTDQGKHWQRQETTIHPDGQGQPSMHMNERGITLRHGKHRGRLIRPSRWYAGKNDSKLWPRHYTNAIYSDDGGRIWHTSDPFPAKGTGEATIAELSDGRLYYNSRRHWAPEGVNPRRRWTAFSDDGGQTWQDLAICEILPDGDQVRNYGLMGGLVRLPVAGRDVLIFSNIESEDGRHHGTVWASFDGGQTWPIKRLVYEGRFAYSSLTAGRPGTATEGWIYLFFEGGPKGGGTLARFNLTWLLQGELTGNGKLPEWLPVPSKADTAQRPLPPMGWNSYTGYSIAVTQDELHKNIDFLSEHLLRYGYDTVTVDNGWFLSGQGKGISIALDAYGRPEAHEHFFPLGLKHTIDYAHSKGINFGIWLLRGINRRAVDENLPVEGTPYRMQDIVNKKSACPWAIAPWWNYGVDLSKPGGQAYYDGLIRKYADMGVDFIKFDDIVPNPDEVEAVVKAIDKCDRKIVLSLSPGDHIKVEHSHAYRMADMVRITSDIWDNRGSLETTFRRWEAMQDYVGPTTGSFLDMDMVCFGRLYVTRNGGRDCKFTEDQKRSFMVQRALAASPLMLGGVLYSMDEFSLNLFTHPDILACQRNAVIGKLVQRTGKLDVWRTPQYGRDYEGWIGVFNRDPKETLSVTLGLGDLGLAGDETYTLKNLWSQRILPGDVFHSFKIPADGVVFLRYEQER